MATTTVRAASQRHGALARRALLGHGGGNHAGGTPVHGVEALFENPTLLTADGLVEPEALFDQEQWEQHAAPVAWLLGDDCAWRGIGCSATGLLTDVHIQASTCKHPVQNRKGSAALTSSGGSAVPPELSHAPVHFPLRLVPPKAAASAGGWEEDDGTADAAQLAGEAVAADAASAPSFTCSAAALVARDRSDASQQQQLATADALLLEFRFSTALCGAAGPTSQPGPSDLAEAALWVPALITKAMHLPPQSVKALAVGCAAQGELALRLALLPDASNPSGAAATVAAATQSSPSPLGRATAAFLEGQLARCTYARGHPALDAAVTFLSASTVGQARVAFAHTPRRLAMQS